MRFSHLNASGLVEPMALPWMKPHAWPSSCQVLISVVNGLTLQRGSPAQPAKRVAPSTEAGFKLRFVAAT
jgi:hypothetical protein